MINLLYITSRIPAPNQRGDQLRAFHQLRILSKTANVTLICLSSERGNQTLVDDLTCMGIDVHCYHLPIWKRSLALGIALFQSIPFQVAYFHNRKIEQKIRARFNSQFDVVHCHLIRTALYARSLDAKSRSIDYMDAYGFGMDLRYSTNTHFLKRFVLKSERNRLLSFESACFDQFDRHFAISRQDALRIKHPENSTIRVSANGIDFDQFYPKSSPKKYDLVFMGNMDYPPNIEAVRFIIDEILPSVLERLPSVKLLVAGRNPTKVIRSYQSDSVDVVEHFDDISDAIASAKIMLAPMTISIGLQNKLLQAMAMKVPCITSKAANNAIGAIPNEQIITATSVQEFVQATINLLENEVLQSSIAETAYEFVHQHFNWEQCVERLISNTQ